MGSMVITFGSSSKDLPWSPLNDIFAVKRIKDAYANDKEKADEKAGKRYLKLFRKMVAKHNTKNHAGKITISAGMGMCTVQIDGVSIEHDRRWNGWNKRKNANNLIRLLFDIDEVLDWDWAWTLDGEALN